MEKNIQLDSNVEQIHSNNLILDQVHINQNLLEKKLNQNTRFFFEKHFIKYKNDNYYKEFVQDLTVL